MQLTSKRHSMVVEFRPHAILTDKFVYTLKFKGDTQSMRLFNKKEMIETQKQLSSELETNIKNIDE